jgi:hypothetical protein
VREEVSAGCGFVLVAESDGASRADGGEGFRGLCYRRDSLLLELAGVVEVEACAGTAPARKTPLGVRVGFANGAFLMQAS